MKSIIHKAPCRNRQAPESLSLRSPKTTETAQAREEVLADAATRANAIHYTRPRNGRNAGARTASRATASTWCTRRAARTQRPSPRGQRGTPTRPNPPSANHPKASQAHAALGRHTRHTRPPATEAQGDAGAGPLATPPRRARKTARKASRLR